MSARLADPVVDWHAILEVVWTSLLGGVGVTAVFAFTLLGAVRSVDARREGRDGAATLYGAGAAIAAAAVLACVVFAVLVIKTK